MAGRVQLATRGTQDVFFTDNPEYTYFIKNFKKHTNFARYTVDHDVTGEVEFGQTLRCTIPQNVGDLLKTVRLHMKLGSIDQSINTDVERGYVESIGHAIINHVDILIGGKLIQRVTSDFLQIHSEHYVTQTKQVNLSKLVGKPPTELSGTPVNSFDILPYLGKATKSQTYVVDVPFYFYNNPELAVPLCALTTQEIEIVVQLNTIDKCIYYTYKPGVDEAGWVRGLFVSDQVGLIENFHVQTELIALDETERVKFQEVPIDFIITQVQSDVSTISPGVRHRHKLEFVNPVKELYFVIQRQGAGVSQFDYDHDSYVSNSVYTNYENLRNLQLRLDADTVLDEKTGNVIHLRAVQSGIHHSRTQLFRRFYSYSFALEPERWYPTGQRNFSMIKEQHVDLSLNDFSGTRELRVYALSYNILRIENGTARLIFQSGPIDNSPGVYIRSGSPSNPNYDDIPPGAAEI
tara:strand:+ start:1344 stop:2732 length:1389 start_codon:yes stop_codon:yes gene_type:complete